MMSFQIHRPKGYKKGGDRYLPEIVKELKRVLKKAQSSFAYDALYLRDRQIGELAGVLVEFAEDIHNDIGIWKSYEQYNRELFHTSLPITVRPGVELEEKELFKRRIHHLTWVWYSVLWSGFIFEPEHKDLILLTGMAADFLEERFAKIPLGSGIKEFLSQPNEYGWDAKRKLVWLGQHSYLFRDSFQNYALEEYAGKVNISIIDDFICQENTCWSGLGVIDILAATLDITEKQRSQVRSWYERHMAYYRVLAVKGPLIEVINLINDKLYTVMVGEPNPFKVQQGIFGSLIPWDNEWYWSGEQKIFPELPESIIQDAKDQFFRELSAVAYRYCEDRAQKAREKVSVYYRRFVECNGDDLVIYPDGASMSADMKKKYPLIYKPDVPSRELEKMKIPEISLPPEITQSRNGIGVYFNPDEGEEIMLGFNDVVSGLEKKGIDLNEYEEESITGFIRSDSISPGFVKKLVEKYGDESIAAVFFIDRLQHTYYLDYLLHRYKGHFYRKRYPGISFS
ncbi:MAG: DUF3843 family protein [bacterium]